MTNEQLQSKLNDLVLGLAQMREERDLLKSQLKQADANILRQEGAIMLLQQLLEPNENNPSISEPVSTSDSDAPHY